jgi:ABC-type phosphate transport system substrate-binding protein
VSKHILDERGRRLGLALALAAAAVVASLWLVPDAQSNFTTTKCNGTAITGRGASFQATAQAGWTSYFNNTYCPGGPSITYDPAGSGAGRRAMGERTGTNADGSQSRNQVPRFGASDEPVFPTGQSQMNQGTDASGDEGQINVIPVLVGAVTLDVNWPDNCDRSLLPDSAETDPSSANASPFVDRVHFTRTQLEEVMNGDSSHDQWTEIFPTLASDPDCNQFITRVVRFDDSGTTFVLKDYLDHINSARGWTTTYISPDTRTWPNASVGARSDCGGASGPQGTHLTSACSNGNGALLQKLLTVDGGIGYSDIATARTNGFDITPSATIGSRDDDVFWTQAANPSSVFQEPTDDVNGFRTDGTHGADCENATFTGVPASTTGDWSNVSGVDSAAGYPICTVSYDLAWSDYKPPYSLQGCGTSCEEQKARTVRDYLFAILSDGGQATLPGNDYDKLPTGLLEKARAGINATCWDKAGGTSTCPGATNYPRPLAATQLKVPLVPEFKQCTAPNSTHVAPLGGQSCTPPVKAVSQLTTGFQKGTATATFTVQPGNLSTLADEADVTIAVTMNDVRNNNGTDYAGKVILNTTMRITDQRNGDVGQLSGTATDRTFGVPIQCTATPSDPNKGGTCNINTSVDALSPNFDQEGKKAVVGMPSVTVLDAGPNGTIGSGCPLNCGDGDEAVYLRQGLFMP